MRVHVGCGSVYLHGYINADLRGAKTFLAKDRPDLVQQLGTTEDQYYARHQDKTIDLLRKGPLDQECVVDEYASLLDLPGSSWSLDEVLVRHAFEHLSINEAHQCLDEADKKLKSGGILRIDVPDHEGTLKKFKETGDEFYIRHLLGPRRNDYGYHMMSYTKERLRNLVESHGFKFVREERNIHFFPAFCLRFEKPGLRSAWDYFRDEISKLIRPEDRVLEIGPGRNPFPRANGYLDISYNFAVDAAQKKGYGTEIINCDLNRHDPPDGEIKYDFVFAAHVFEHLDDLKEGARKISKMGKRGVIIVPTLFKDVMFNMEELDHKWWFLPSTDMRAPLRAIPINNGWTKQISNEDYRKAMSRLYRTGPFKPDSEYRLLRSWFYDSEPHLDVFHYWEGELKVEIL